MEKTKAIFYLERSILYSFLKTAKRPYCSFKVYISAVYPKSFTLRLFHGIIGRYFTLRSAGVILVTMITVNAILLITFRKPVTLWQSAVCALLLFIGIISLFSNTSWQALKQSSIILRRIK